MPWSERSEGHAKNAETVPAYAAGKGGAAVYAAFAFGIGGHQLIYAQRVAFSPLRSIQTTAP